MGVSEMTALAKLRSDAMSEAELQANVVDLARFFHWLDYHTHDSRRSQPGFPDLVLSRAPRLMFVELKSEKGKLDPSQTEWLDELGGVRDANPLVEVHLWRPSDYYADRIVEALR